MENEKAQRPQRLAAPGEDIVWGTWHVYKGKRDKPLVCPNCGCTESYVQYYYYKSDRLNLLTRYICGECYTVL